MNIEKKITEIRKQPEHIRERYVWIAVGISMLFILGIWFFSFKTVFKQKREPEMSTPVRELIDKSKESIGKMPTIEDVKQ